MTMTMFIQYMSYSMKTWLKSCYIFITDIYVNNMQQKFQSDIPFSSYCVSSYLVNIHERLKHMALEWMDSLVGKISFFKGSSTLNDTEIDTLFIPSFNTFRISHLNN